MSENILQIAAAELGNAESPPGSNMTKYGEWYGLNGKPWCMIFVQWCFARAGRTLPYKTASCSGLLSWYRKNQPEGVVSEPQRGDIAIYKFGHTGIIEAVADGTITDIEGNTSAGEAGSQSNGGGVFRRTRSKALVAGYIRPFDDLNEEEDSMVYYKTLADVPASYKSAVQKAVDSGALSGTGTGVLNVSEDLCRILTILDRMGKLN